MWRREKSIKKSRVVSSHLPHSVTAGDMKDMVEC